ncbi:hypothetical protein J8273_4609 [Carpediemonas membranifera]|uniref:Ras-GAP domain-containing protein n=1 Tax=Carpediemonas membranifera TaxID=201153 RepID=A0A8J6B4A0_9EUKA|nr:hypothetical protein J8273_4609 [Carpediemonas membranifera]|eukprot:KAG9394009.1 hypothetical protein J8273_4609 [Carpediemonas membranifera]
MSWTGEYFEQLRHDYKNLIAFYRDAGEVCATISNNIPASEYPGLARFLLKACGDEPSMLALMPPLLDAEFAFAKNDITTFMRERSRLPNRFTGEFILHTSSDFLVNTLRPFVTDLCQQRMLTMEVDYDKTVSDLEKKQELLIEYSQKLLDHLLSDAVVAAIPRPLRALLALLYRTAREKYSEEQAIPLIGNVYILRFLNPGLSVPDYYGVLPPSMTCGVRSRRNLVLVAKMLQALSNGVMFGDKEDYMKPMNPFIEKNLAPVCAHLLALTEDPEGKDFADILDPTPLDLEDPALMNRFQLRELAIAHRLLSTHGAKLRGLLGEKYAPVAALVEMLPEAPRIGPEPWYNPKEPRVKEYHVVKVNKKGKRQNRVIKLTLNSLLNIDKQEQQIKNELLVSEMSALMAPAHTPTLVIVHGNPPDISKDTPGYFPHRDKGEDGHPRTYECTNIRIRDEVLGEVFEMIWAYHAKPVPVAYDLVKVNKYGKRQNRVFKLTRDSVMNMRGSHIQTETHFATVAAVQVEGSTLYMTIEGEDSPRENILKTPELAEELCRAIKDGMRRFESGR